MIEFLLLIILGYLLGSIPFGYLLCKVKGTDIRKVGSGATGGTNVIRALGIKWGILVTVLDLLKGVASAYLAISFLIFDWQIAAVALSPVVGHIFPVWLGFKGGKGVAATLGVLVVLLEGKIILPLLLIWLLVLALSRISSFSNLSMAAYFPLAFWLSYFSLAYLSLGLLFFVLIWWAHRENLNRIKKGAEPSIKLRRSPSKN